MCVVSITHLSLTLLSRWWDLWANRCKAAGDVEKAWRGFLKTPHPPTTLKVRKEKSKSENQKDKWDTQREKTRKKKKQREELRFDSINKRLLSCQPHWASTRITFDRIVFLFWLLEKRDAWISKSLMLTFFVAMVFYPSD